MKPLWRAAIHRRFRLESFRFSHPHRNGRNAIRRRKGESGNEFPHSQGVPRSYTLFLRRPVVTWEKTSPLKLLQKPFRRGTSFACFIDPQWMQGKQPLLAGRFMKLHDTRGGNPQGELGRFYRDALACLQKAGFRFLICGGYAFEFHTGIRRRTKDIDLFVMPQDVGPMLDTLQVAGYRTHFSEPGWLAKVHSGEDFIDIIYNSGNGLCPVDESWFAHGVAAELLDLNVQISPVEEMIWQKCYIQVRHRYDGADVAHLILARGDNMDWPRLLARFGDHWPVLLSQLILFQYIYPGEKEFVPRQVMDELLQRVEIEKSTPANGGAGVCRGTLLSKFDFQTDVEEWEYADPRAPLFRS